MIELCHVTAGYPGRPVLEDVNLAFQAGKITALIGPNGCGKTTLLRAACGLLPLSGGQVLYGGKDLLLLNPEILRAQDPFEAEEGCLSLPGTRKVRRYGSIKVRYCNEKFQVRVRTFTGWTAQILQHEIDHCNGVLV